jgi:hypothetical protein
VVRLLDPEQDGIPYLAPELVLLFKAKHVRHKDQADFDLTIPHLTRAQRSRLAELLAIVHPGTCLARGPVARSVSGGR